MEGFLLKKTKDKSFGSGWLGDKAKTWKKQWFVLDDQTVTFYEDFDLSTDSPTQENGSFSIAGCEILPVTHKTKKNIFLVKDPDTNNTLMYVQANDAKTMGVWVKALTMAARGDHLAQEVNYDEYYAKLGLDPSVEHEPSVVNRAFRTAVAQTPTARDGRAPGFKELQEAFNHIMAHLNDLEEAKLYRLAYYEAVVVKGGPGEGLGIAVQEEVDGRNVVKGVRESLRIKSITGEVGEDGIEEGDQLVQLNGMDVSTMPLVRVAQRMNDFRIPPHSEVKLVFARKVLREEFRDEVSELEDDLGLGSVAQSQAQSQAHEGYPDEAYDYQEVQEVEAPYHPQEYTRSPSQQQQRQGVDDAAPQRPLSRANSGQSWGLQVTERQRSTSSGQEWSSPAATAASRPPLSPQVSTRSQGQSLSRSQSRSASPSALQQQQTHHEANDPLSSQESVSHPRPSNLNRKDSARDDQQQQSVAPSANARARPMSYAGSPTGSSSTKHTMSPPDAPPVAPPRPVTMGRQASVLSMSGATVTTPPAPAPAPAPAPVPVPALAGRPLSVKVDAINSKEYFRRSSLQMKSPAEIAEMKRDLDFCLRELQHASKRIEDLEFHNRNLESEVARYKALYADSARHERLLETQLEQYLIHSTVTAEFMEESMNDMLYVSKQIAENQPIPVSSSVTNYLFEVGLGEDASELDGSKASQRTAIAAAAAIDKTGLMLQKWAMTGDPIMNKLSRFEEHVQRLDGAAITGSTRPTPPLSPSRDQPPSPAVPVSPPLVKQPQLYRQPSSAGMGTGTGQGSAMAQTAASAARRGPLQMVSPMKRGPPALSPVPGGQATGPVAMTMPSPSPGASPARPADPRLAQLLRQSSSASMSAAGSPGAGRASTDPQAAQLVRQGSLYVSPPQQGKAPPLVRAASMGGNRGPTQQPQPNQSPAQPLVNTLLTRSLQR